MELRICLQQIQDFLADKPLVVLGSGASAAYGLPLMGNLKEGILSGDNFTSVEFEVFLQNLELCNLEEALDKSGLTEELSNRVREYVWNSVNTCDIAYFSRLCGGEEPVALTKLLKQVLRPTPNEATVITTNYDRIVEYATDIIGATAITGFEGNFIKKLELPSDKITQARIRARERRVNIWKVHGSLDWFSNSTAKIVSYPLSTAIPPNHTPLIIPPGKGKYSSTHNEPYRDIIARADIAIERAGAFICVGYGFNDEHIQTKLIEQIKTGKPIVALCQSATPACKQLVISDDVAKYAVLEQGSADGTKVTSSFGGGSPINYDETFWSLDCFVKMIWGL